MPQKRQSQTKNIVDSVFVGIAFFFIVQGVSKTPRSDSGLRFKSIPADLKKPGVIIWLLFMPVVSTITLIMGNIVFGEEYSAHLLGRADDFVSYDKIAIMAVQVIILALGEEIAYRGFFFGKGQKIFPIWLCAVVSSVCFAAGHIAVGDIGVAAWDIASVFIDSLLLSVIYQKSGNCAVSTISHILGNGIALFVMMTLF